MTFAELHTARFSIYRVHAYQTRIEPIIALESGEPLTIAQLMDSAHACDSLLRELSTGISQVQEELQQLASVPTDYLDQIVSTPIGRMTRREYRQQCAAARIEWAEAEESIDLTQQLQGETRRLRQVAVDRLAAHGVDWSTVDYGRVVQERQRVAELRRTRARMIAAGKDVTLIDGLISDAK